MWGSWNSADVVVNVWLSPVISIWVAGLLLFHFSLPYGFRQRLATVSCEFVCMKRTKAAVVVNIFHSYTSGQIQRSYNFATGFLEACTTNIDCMFYFLKTTHSMSATISILSQLTSLCEYWQCCEIHCVSFLNNLLLSRFRCVRLKNNSCQFDYTQHRWL